MSRTRARIPVGLLSLVLLAGCTAEEPAPLPTVAATQDATPTPTPTPTPTGPPDALGQVYDQSNPELGIVFEDIPEDLSGDAADVYNTLALYEVEYWRALTTHAISPVVSTISSPELVGVFERFTANNSEAGLEISGTYRTRIYDVVVDGDTATSMLCDQFSEATFDTDDGSWTATEVGLDERIQMEASLVRGLADGQWQITATDRQGTC